MKNYLFTLLLSILLLSTNSYNAEAENNQYTVKFYSDESTGGLTSDGRTFEDRKSNWQQAVDSISARIATGNAPAQDLSNSLGNGFGPNNYSLNRLHFSFDTSSLPEDAVITDASFNFFGKDPDYSSGTEQRIYLVESHPADPGTLTTSDYANVGNVAFGVTDGTWDVSTQNTIVLNNAGIDSLNNTGVTSFALRGWYDFNQVAPTNDNELYVHILLVDNEGIEKDPYLEVTYTLPEEERTVPLVTQVVSPYPSVDETSSWADDVYANGSATEPDDCGLYIKNCGCAITSLTMLALNYGITTGIDGTEVNPGNLNSWLEANNGYDRTGHINWRRALRYFSNIPGHSWLSLDHQNTSDTTLLDSYVTNGQPAIAHASIKHFIVLTDVLAGGLYGVNDPFWFNTKTTSEIHDALQRTQSYNGSIDRVNLFSYSETAQPIAGWIEIHLGSPAELLITDSQGRRAGYDPETDEVVLEIPGSSYGEESIGNPYKYDEEGTSSVHLIKVLAIQPAEDDVYDLKVVGTGEGTYDLSIDTGGEGMPDNTEYITGTTTPGDVDTYIINGDEKKHHGIKNAIEKINEQADKKAEWKEKISNKLHEVIEHLVQII